MSDLAVVMDARLYDVEPAFYAEHVAPLFVPLKDKAEKRLVAKMPPALVKMLLQQKLIVADDALKIRPGQKTTYLSWQRALFYRDQPGDPDKEQVNRTLLEGVSFHVLPIVSPDRRCIRLDLSQEMAQLVKITKGTRVDLKTNKEYPVDLPNLKKSKSSVTVEIHDGQPILIAVDYRPSDRVWLLLAWPSIYMEEEEEEIRKGNIAEWRSWRAPQPKMPPADPAPPEPPMEDESAPVPPVPLPNTVAMKELLQAVVLKLMTDPQLKEYRDRNSSSGDTRYALVPDALAWPRSFRSEVPGYVLQDVDPDECLSFKSALLGISLEKYTRSQKETKGWDVLFVAHFQNAGGLVNARPFANRWCPIHCRAKRVGERWLVECQPRGFDVEVIDCRLEMPRRGEMRLATSEKYR
jgi:hypothetical protein